MEAMDTEQDYSDTSAATAAASADNTQTEVYQTWDPQQPYQQFEFDFSSSTTHSFERVASTGQAFNTTVGTSRQNQGRASESKNMTNAFENNFIKSLKWSPDGSCLLAGCNDNYLYVVATPDTTAAATIDSTTGTSSINETEQRLLPGMVVKEGETVYDMCWFPGMTTLDQASCCFLSSSRDHPVRLWDAYTGKVRCSYTILDHCEVNVAPNSICFNPDGTKIYCGSNNMIQIFDTSRPGRDCEKRPTVKTRKSKEGQKGVISCLTFNPDRSNLYAAGSYSKTIGLYDALTDKLLMLLRDKNNNAKRVARRKKAVEAATAAAAAAAVVTAGGETNGQPIDQPLTAASILVSPQPASLSIPPMGGLTQLQFSPDGLYLYSASRKDAWIRCWDIRNTTKVLYRLERPGTEDTNQRIGFDLSANGRWLSTGDAHGDISIFDLWKVPSEDLGDTVDRLATKIKGAHGDIITAATFNPVYPILATSSGQRKYTMDLSDSEDSDSEQERADENQNEVMKEASSWKDPTEEIDNSIHLWSIPGKTVWYANGQPWEPSE